MRMSTLLLLVTSLALPACGDEKEDDGSDGSDGADPSTMDSDGDGISDADEEAAGTDPNAADSDGDGIDDADEAGLGTDPVNEDSDGDGFSDGAEVEAGSDPVAPFSWPFGSGEWPDFSDEAAAAGVDGTRYAMGEVFPNFTTLDQFGNEVELYQFYGMVILLDFSAGWCGPCRQAAMESEEMWETYREDGFIILHAIIDNNSGGAVEQSFLEGWADQYGINFPVIDGDDSGGPDQAYNGLYRSGLNEGYIPYMVMMDTNMVLVEQFVGAGNERTIERKIEEYAGIE